MTKPIIKSLRLFLFALLATTSVRAQSVNLLQNPNADLDTQFWRAMREATVEEIEGNHCFVVRNGGSFYQDVTLIQDATGQYAVLVGRGSAERINADGAITGLPYLYGYMMSAAEPGGGRIHAHLQGQRMLGSATSKDEWVKMWGIFRVPEGTGRIRFFLSQASRQGVPHNGSAARFDDLGLFLFPTEEAARAFLGVSAEAQPKPQQKPPIVDAVAHAALVEKFKKGGEVDFTKLRQAFYESADYNPDAPMLTYRPLYGALTQTNYAEAIKIAQSVLEKNFVEVNAHIVAHVAYRESGDTERAQFHKYVADGLLNSIKSTGDGKSVDTAFNVISINEEYGLLRSIGLTPIHQALIANKGHSFDALTVVDPKTNQQSLVYFNVDKPFKWRRENKSKSQSH